MNATDGITLQGSDCRYFTTQQHKTPNLAHQFCGRHSLAQAVNSNKARKTPTASYSKSMGTENSLPLTMRIIPTTQAYKTAFHYQTEALYLA